jgi:RimJ/RimL family protein N-acetyltransferase
MDLAPLRELRLTTARLELRLGSRDELVELAEVARRGVNAPEEMPFSVPWTDDADRPSWVADYLDYHASRLREWRPDAWWLELLVWAEGRLAGAQALAAEDFAERRTVHTASWLGLGFQRRGIGTEMRRAVLELAFGGLGARAAESAWLEGNDGSRRVSQKLGYRTVGERIESPRGEPVRAWGCRLEKSNWQGGGASIEGLAGCMALFGAA